MRTIPVYIAVIAALLLPSAARAQGARGLARIPAEEVIVTQSASGEELRGHIVELSPTTLALLVNGSRVDVPIETVLRIDARTDSVKDGAAIGGGIFLGLAAIGCAAGLPRDAAQCVSGLVFNTLFGTLAGAGIDAMHKGRTTIYSKPGPGREASVGFKIRF